MTGIEAGKLVAEKYQERQIINCYDLSRDYFVIGAIDPKHLIGPYSNLFMVNKNNGNISDFPATLENMETLKKVKQFLFKPKQ